MGSPYREACLGISQEICWRSPRQGSSRGTRRNLPTRLGPVLVSKQEKLGRFEPVGRGPWQPGVAPRERPRRGGVGTLDDCRRRYDVALMGPCSQATGRSDQTGDSADVAG